MKECLLSEVVLDLVRDKLGPARQDLGDQALGLMASKEDHVLVWSGGQQALLALYTGSGNVEEGGRIQELSLATCPTHQVQEVVVSRSGLWVALWGPEGVTAVQMPRRAGLGGRLGGGAPRVVCRSVPVYRGAVQDVAWHPASEAHLVLLTRGGHLSLHNVADGVGEVRGTRVAQALGEAAVSLSFGGGGPEGQWPLFVLYGNGDLFCVRAAIAGEWDVEGPLEVRPPREDNYCGEACSLTVCGDNVVVVATMGGVIYHSVVLGGGDTSLHTYERVELDLGAVGQGADTEGVFSCPVRVRVDRGMSSKYLASHRAGLHQVEVNMVTQLSQEGDPDLTRVGSVVEHLVCTRPTPTSPPAPVIGACLSYPPSTVLCLLSDNTVTSLLVSPASLSNPSLVSREDQTSSLDIDLEEEPQLDSQMKTILARSSCQPLLVSGSGTSLSPAETLELLTGATSTLRREYVARLQIAREELVRRDQALRVRREGQEGCLAALEQEREVLRDQAGQLSERYEDVKDQGQDLSRRVEVALARVQAKVPGLSDAELAMSREVGGLGRKVQALQMVVKQLKEKERYQRYQAEASGVARRDSLDQTRLCNMKEVLQEDSQSIADLVQDLTNIKKDLGI